MKIKQPKPPIDAKLLRKGALSQLRALNNSGQLTIFLGAGISASCGLPDWSRLIEALHAELIHADVQMDEAEDTVTLAKIYFGHKFNTILASCLYRNELHISESALSVARSGIRSIVCFNFDDIMEEILKTEGISHKAILNGEKFKLTNDQMTIFHPHGYLGRFDSKEEQEASQVVLSKADYAKLYDDHYCLTNLIQLSMLITRAILFAGMSVTDPNTIRLLGEAKRIGASHWHYALMKRETDLQVQSESKRLRGLGIIPVWYEDHSEIPEIMGLIRKA